MNLLQCTIKQTGQDNKTENAVVHNEEHKITNNILQNLLSLLRNGNSKTQISASLLHQISTKSVAVFTEYMEMSIMTLCNPGFIFDQYGSKVELFNNCDGSCLN
jgi:hypothetical protein